MEENKLKACVKLLREKSSVEDRDDIRLVELVFENATDVILSEINIEASSEILIENTFVYDADNIGGNGTVVTKYKSICGGGFINDRNTYTYTLMIKKYQSILLLLSFNIIIESIFGYKSKQVFNVMLMNNNIMSYKTKVN